MSESAAIRTIYTIGHGNRSFDEFRRLLEGAAIDVVADVRAFPGSRRHPHFGRGELEAALRSVGLGYIWEGEGLGGRRRARSDSRHLALRNSSFRAYADHMETPCFRDAVERLLLTSRDLRPALMCAERLPWQCHRYMIADYLVAHGYEVLHLMDGSQPRRHSIRAEARIENGTLVYDRATQSDLQL